MALSVIVKSKIATLYLNNSTGAPVAGGAATAAATTPFMVVDDTWTIQAARPDVIWSGGPPFANGSFPIGLSYGNVTETFTLILVGTSADNVTARKQQLEQMLNIALFHQPCMLGVQPNGATNMMYAEIFSAVVQPTTNYLVQPMRGSTTLTLQITITRSPFWTSATEETCFSGTSFTNNGGATALFGTISGDLTYELGQPLNVTLSGGDLDTSGVKNIWLAAVRNTPSGSNRADAISTTSSSGVNVGATFSYSAWVDMGVKQRITCRVASPTANLQIRAVVSYDLTTNATLYTSPWVTGGSTSGAFYDLGAIDLPLSARRLSTSTMGITVQIQARSTNGASATGTLTWIKGHHYYTWCKLTSSSVPASTTFQTYAYKASAITSALVLVNPPIAAAGTSYAQNIQVRGQLPRAYDSARLWAIWDAAGAHDDADTISVTATQAPLYRTLRGAG